MGAASPPGLAAHADVEAELSDGDFRLVAEIIRREAGIVVRDHKQAMVRGRLARRARDLGLPSVGAYCERLRGPALADELPGLMNALTTNHTAFWREPHHFDHLESTALPSLLADGRRRLRMWCAAASTGEEPYTIAATAQPVAARAGASDCLILATDLDSEVLKVAEAGRYPAGAISRLTDAQRARLAPLQQRPDEIAMRAELKAMLRFRQLNILHEWPFRGPFQIIFCRNMLIYFDTPTKTEIVARMAAMLEPGGFLYLGHSEALTQALGGLQPCGRTVYRKA